MVFPSTPEPTVDMYHLDCSVTLFYNLFFRLRDMIIIGRKNREAIKDVHSSLAVFSCIAKCVYMCESSSLPCWSKQQSPPFLPLSPPLVLLLCTSHHPTRDITVTEPVEVVLCSIEVSIAHHHCAFLWNYAGLQPDALNSPSLLTRL